MRCCSNFHYRKCGVAQREHNMSYWKKGMSAMTCNIYIYASVPVAPLRKSTLYIKSCIPFFFAWNEWTRPGGYVVLLPSQHCHCQGHPWHVRFHLVAKPVAAHLVVSYIYSRLHMQKVHNSTNWQVAGALATWTASWIGKLVHAICVRVMKPTGRYYMGVCQKLENYIYFQVSHAISVSYTMSSTMHMKLV